MSDLLSWLRSTIEGDKAAAKAAGGQKWTAREESWETDRYAFIRFGKQGRTGDSCGCCSTGTIEPVKAVHMALHDPRDTIARCDAELRLIALCESATEYALKRPSGNSAYLVAHQSDILVRLLASGYRHRPGFNPEWVSE